MNPFRSLACADPESFFRVFFFFFFFLVLVDEGIQIPLKAGHQRPASETPFKWRFAGWPPMTQTWLLCFFCVIFQGIRTSIA